MNNEWDTTAVETIHIITAMLQDFSHFLKITVKMLMSVPHYIVRCLII